MPQNERASMGVDTLLGDPKKAIVKLSVPMIIAMTFQTVYNLVDAIWVAGLGANELAAVGFAFPIFFAITGFANGIGIGGSSAISRYIGRGDRRRAEQSAEHALVVGVFVAALISLPLWFFAQSIFESMGAAHTATLATEYGSVLFGGSIIIFLTSILSFLLRGEGDAKRASYVMVAGSLLNVILDPIFIYVLDMGIAGAAWATLVAFSATNLVMLHWYFVKKDTYIRIRLRYFSFDKEIAKEVFQVGLPASVQMVSMAITQLSINFIILMVANTDGVAVYSTGWRVISMAIIPLQGIASAVVPVTGAAFGSRSYDKLSIAHSFSVGFGLKIGVAIGIFILVFAPWISLLFSWSDAASHLARPITEFIRINSIMIPGVAFGLLSSSTFQGMGMGMRALIATLARAVVLTMGFTYLLGVVLGFGLTGIWVGLCVANIIGSFVVYSWVRHSIRYLIRPKTFI